MLFGRHIAELNATNNTLVRSYVWGLDLSGTMGGAGGVGGLLWVTLHTASGAAPGTHFCAYDGNGNIVALSAASDGAETACYEYGPFSESIRVTGPAANQNPFRFSTKRTDSTADLVLYEYRVYSPTLGRWPNRDPINEQGFKVLTGRSQSLFDFNEEKSHYNFLNNNLVNSVDYLGLADRTRNPDNSQTVTVGKCEVAILVGHGRRGRPHIFKGTSEACWAGGFIGCYAKETNDRLGSNRVPGSPSWEDEIADKDPEYQEAWKAIQQGARTKAEEICKNAKCCCKEVTITFLYAPAYDLPDLAAPALPKDIKVKCQ
jgi:RHS repeat-associated protein